VQEDIAMSVSKEIPQVGSFNHVSVPCRDLDEAKRFFTEIFGAPVILEVPSKPPFAEVQLGGVIIGLSLQPGGWTGPGAEFPHYAFLAETDEMLALKERLESFGVPTHPIYTRMRVEGLMYFRDPSGNLFEFYCEKFRGADKLPVAASVGGTFTVDFKALNYSTWKLSPK
jgi:catechol 2,3-dioxygenase-like lactoylglutathione lyase family enzyme